MSAGPSLHKITDMLNKQYVLTLTIPFDYTEKHKDYKWRIFRWMLKMTFKVLGPEKK